MKAVGKRIVWWAFARWSGSAPLRTKSRWIAKSCPPGHSIIYEKYLDEFSVWLDNAISIETQVIHAGYENDLIAVLGRFLRAGDVAIDIGANVGLLSLAMAQRVGITGKVLAFEPGPRFFERFHANLAENSTASSIISAERVGLSDRAQVLYWQEDPSQKGNAMLGPSGEVAVSVTTLDRAIAESGIDRLRFLKIDVEGMEWEVLKGGQESIKRFRPLVYFETLPETPIKRGFDVFQQIVDLVAPFGYQLNRVNLDGSIEPATVASLSHNSMLIPTS
jgi:FkbM family methyltransferase